MQKNIKRIVVGMLIVGALVVIGSWVFVETRISGLTEIDKELYIDRIG